MPNYAKLRDHLSHRVTVEYDTGAKITGQLSGCRPGQGPVQFVTLSKVEMFDAEGNLVEQHDTLSLCPNVLTRFERDEGPTGRDL